jgi:lysophospholipase L1-like esterase
LYLSPHLFLPFAPMRTKYINLLFFFLFLAFSSHKSAAQPFIEDIQNFKKQDSIAAPPKNAILFVGSSSFTNWKDVQSYFPTHIIINRGFGGSSLTDVIRYANDIIFPYQPKQIVIYCGENDIAGDSVVTGKMVYERFKQLFEIIRKKSPNVPIAFISLKPSPSRWYLKEKMIDANIRIKKYLKKKNNANFINVYNAMLDANGTPKKEIFLEDNLHMKANGYAIWQKIIEPYLKK